MLKLCRQSAFAVEEKVIRALAPAVDAAVQASLAPAVGAAVSAAVEGAARAAARAASVTVNGGEAASPDALHRAVTAAMQPVVEQLVKAVQTASVEVRGAIAAASVQQYNVAAAAHNIWAISQGGSARLILLRNSAGKAPQGQQHQPQLLSLRI